MSQDSLIASLMLVVLALLCYIGCVLLTFFGNLSFGGLHSYAK